MKSCARACATCSAEPSPAERHVHIAGCDTLLTRSSVGRFLDGRTTMKLRSSSFLPTLLALVFAEAATSGPSEENLLQLTKHLGSGDSSGAPCAFPAQSTITPGTFIAVETDSSTTIFTEGIVTVGWHPGGDFTVNDLVYPSRVERRIPNPEATSKAYRSVPLMEDLLETGMSITAAASTCSNDYESLRLRALSQYLTGISWGLSPMDAAARSQTFLASSALVRSAQELAQGGDSIVIKVEYYGHERTGLLFFPLKEVPVIQARLDVSDACEMLDEIARFLSDSSDTKRVLILRNGSRGVVTGDGAEKYLNELR